MNKLKAGVIFGGMSTEHDVSISSGTSIIKNLSKEKYEILPIYISEDGSWYKYTKNIEEIEKSNDKIEKVTGSRTKLYRPPYGEYNNIVIVFIGYYLKA